MSLRATRKKSKALKANAEMDKLYRRIPEVHCKGLCQEACSIIPMQESEARRLKARTGEWPTYDAKELRCSMLTEDGKCSVYGIRPLVCRLFGAVRKMTCPHGCVPDRWVSEAEARAITEQAVRIGGACVFPNPRGSAQNPIPLTDLLDRKPEGGPDEIENK